VGADCVRRGAGLLLAVVNGALARFDDERTNENCTSAILYAGWVVVPVKRLNRYARAQVRQIVIVRETFERPA